MIKWVKRLVKRLFHSEKKFLTSKKDESYFDSITIMDKTPNEDSLNEKDFVEVVYRNQSYWAIFNCPCACKNVITLPLQKNHNPHWKLEHSIEGKPTLYPSVWQNKGCLSHFWIANGKIEWCSNTGIEPWVAEPKYYKKPIS
ncbi:DUF6527 family protein [Gaoshiqia sp. Z1-71]|uniref:DUF6527 family protein n=1 Tax=Gaoshiqia hydrogeniformans TaxID=3290090 RepID=UPI003BF85406